MSDAMQFEVYSDKFVKRLNAEFEKAGLKDQKALPIHPNGAWRDVASARRDLDASTESPFYIKLDPAVMKDLQEGDLSWEDAEWLRPMAMYVDSDGDLQLVVTDNDRFNS